MKIIKVESCRKCPYLDTDSYYLDGFLEYIYSCLHPGMKIDILAKDKIDKSIPVNCCLEDVS